MKSPVILITGAGKGIGKSIVLEILKHSAISQPNLVLTSRTQADLEELQALCLRQAIPCEILAIDLAKEPLSAVDQALKTFGRIDLFIHCAGVGRFGHFLELTDEDFSFVMETNLKASFKLMQATYRQMSEQKSGSIVWITSVAAEKPFKQSAIYCMSKYAQQGLLDVMRLYAQKDGIRMINVKPGPVMTPMWGDVDASMEQQMIHPEDVASVVMNALLLPSRACVEEITIRPIVGDVLIE